MYWRVFVSYMQILYCYIRAPLYKGPKCPQMLVSAGILDTKKLLYVISVQVMPRKTEERNLLINRCSQGNFLALGRTRLV